MKNKSVLFGILLCSLVLTLTGCTKNSFSGKETIFEKQKQVTNLENLQLTFGTQKITTELKPPNPVGYFDYYEEIDNYQYLVYEVILENKGVSDINLKNLVIQVQLDKQISKAKLVSLDIEKKRFENSLKGQEKVSGYLFTALKKERINTSSTADRIKIYYNKNLTSNGESQQFDFEKMIDMK
ncbi:hypothetical protein IGJ48_002601 [Enterococcus pernyi]